ncbi:hypothetical protein [uncultured Mycobacterium sp.]|uniref:hypothetical protein n=1 Tax=uncultured Mycobacterium sp. TaxID=171292 RepID=UPI0035CA072E
MTYVTAKSRDGIDRGFENAASFAQTLPPREPLSPPRGDSKRGALGVDTSPMVGLPNPVNTETT